MLWAVRILTGAQAGQIFPLKSGQHMIGRSPSCEVKINSNSVSKEHASLMVTDDKLILADMDSRNGTFVNGVRIQNQRLGLGDKIALHDILLDVLKVPESMSTAVSRPVSPVQAGAVYQAPPPAWAGNVAAKIQTQLYAQGQHGPVIVGDNDEQQVVQSYVQPGAGGFFHNIKVYIDNVAMPGIYSVAQSMPYKYAILIFIALYAFLVTALSTVPVVTTTRNNIRQESMRRATTIVRHMAAVNRQALIDRNDLALNISQAEREEGVTLAVLINAKDGTVIAPANQKGSFLNKPFIHKVRREEKEVAEFIDTSTLGASVPVTFYSAESGSPITLAYAIVLYDLGSLAMNSAQTFKMFIENLTMAIVLGVLLFFFLAKLIENPILALNNQLDDALREGRDDLKTDYQFEPLENLASKINSALSRIGSGSGPAQVEVDREPEAAHLVTMLPLPAISVSAIDNRIIATNQGFDRLVGGGVNLVACPLTDIPDQALQKKLGEDLIPRLRSSYSEIATSTLEFGGNLYELNGHAVMGSSEPAYFFIVISPVGGNG